MTMVFDILFGAAGLFALILVDIVSGHVKAQRRANRMREREGIETEYISYG